MPTYAYECAACGHAFDAVQKFSDDPLTECPACAGRVRRVIHPAPIVFKGTGWYITDSRAAGANGKKDAAADGDSTKTSDKAADKPAAKTEPAAAAAD